MSWLLPSFLAPAAAPAPANTSDPTSTTSKDSAVRPILAPYDFEVAISTDVGTVVVYCYAEWHESTPSMMLLFEDLAKQYFFRFYKMNLDDPALNALAADQTVEAHPCVLIYQNSQMVGKIEGVKPKMLARVLKEIEEHGEDDWWGQVG